MIIKSGFTRLSVTKNTTEWLNMYISADFFSFVEPHLVNILFKYIYLDMFHQVPPPKSISFLQFYIETVSCNYWWWHSLPKYIYWVSQLGFLWYLTMWSLILLSQRDILLGLFPYFSRPLFFQAWTWITFEITKKGITRWFHILR
jgi:hypothetical protein